MIKDLWLPMGYDLPNGTKIRGLLYGGEEWQIFKTTESKICLLVQPTLVKKWGEHGFLDVFLFEDVYFGNKSFGFLSSPKNYILAPVENGKSPESKVDAIAFASALKESRKCNDEASFHDAVYVEQYSRLLPVWTLTPHVDDDVVLGTWITGGVVVSTESFRRLNNLAGWMSTCDLAEIITVAGFSVPSDAPLLARRKVPPEAKSKKKIPQAIKDADNQNTQPLNTKSEPKVFELPGRPHLEQFFNEHVIDLIFNAEKYQALGIDFPSAIALHGPPGCGKTFAVERLVEFIDWPSFSIDSNSVGSPYIHATSKKISEVFDKAIDSAPAVVVIDEMESFLSDRRAGGTSGTHHVEEVAEFLRRIPEAIQNRVLIIAMTNMIETIDPAILRRGRFDHIIEVPMPSRAEVKSLLISLLEKLPVDKDINLKPLLDALTGKALSDSAFVIREAARLAARNNRESINQHSLELALGTLPKNQEKENRKIGFSPD